MIKIENYEKCLQSNYFGVKIVKEISFGVWTYYKLYFGFGNITEKDQLTCYAAL